MELVSQAEKEGVSLGVLISRHMTPDEMDAAQMDLAAAMNENFAAISHFMAGVEVPSIEEIVSGGALSGDIARMIPSDELAAD